MSTRDEVFFSNFPFQDSAASPTCIGLKWSDFLYPKCLATAILRTIKPRNRTWHCRGHSNMPTPMKKPHLRRFLYTTKQHHWRPPRPETTFEWSAQHQQSFDEDKTLAACIMPSLLQRECSGGTSSACPCQLYYTATKSSLTTPSTSISCSPWRTAPKASPPLGDETHKFQRNFVLSSLNNGCSANQMSRFTQTTNTSINFPQGPGSLPKHIQRDNALPTTLQLCCRLQTRLLPTLSTDLTLFTFHNTYCQAGFNITKGQSLMPWHVGAWVQHNTW